MNIQVNKLGFVLVLVFLAVVLFWGWAVTGYVSAPSAGQLVLPSNPPVPLDNKAQDKGVQDVFLRATSAGVYEPGYIQVKQGVPVNLHFSAEVGAGCGRTLVIPAFKVWKVAPTTGAVVAQFTPLEKGVFEFSCSMRMFRGKLEVV